MDTARKMEDKTALTGFMGSFASISLGQWNLIVGIAAGVMTCLYVGYKFVVLWKERHDK